MMRPTINEESDCLRKKQFASPPGGGCETFTFFSKSLHSGGNAISETQFFHGEKHAPRTPRIVTV